MPAPYRPDYPIRTPRLDLRPQVMSDLDDMLGFHSDPEVVRYIPWPVRDREMTQAALSQNLDRHTLTAAGEWLVLAIELRAERKVIGSVLLKWESEEHQLGEIGYAIARAHHGHGYAPEAAAALISWGFGDLGLHRIVGRVDSRNTPSARVLAGLGMREEAYFREDEFFKGEWTDTRYFAILADEWAARPAAPHSTPRA